MTPAQPRKPMTLRKRIERSPALERLFGGLLGRYLGFCHRTTDWQVEGLDQLQLALRDGPVLLMIWHSRLSLAMLHWPLADGPMSSIHDSSPIARITGAMQARVGLRPIAMSKNAGKMAATRMLLARVADGISIGLTADGPQGPALTLKDPPLDWARVTGLPIFTYAFSTTHSYRLSSWDKMLIPRPYARGAYIFRRFPDSIPRKMDDDARAALRAALQDWMMQAMRDCDALIGGAPGP